MKVDYEYKKYYSMKKMIITLICEVLEQEGLEDEFYIDLSPSLPKPETTGDGFLDDIAISVWKGRVERQTAQIRDSFTTPLDGIGNEDDPHNLNKL